MPAHFLVERKQIRAWPCSIAITALTRSAGVPPDWSNTLRFGWIVPRGPAYRLFAWFDGVETSGRSAVADASASQ
jgi:hypothetical protein